MKSCLGLCLMLLMLALLGLGGVLWHLSRTTSVERTGSTPGASAPAH